MWIEDKNKNEVAATSTKETSDKAQISNVSPDSIKSIKKGADTSKFFEKKGWNDVSKKTNEKSDNKEVWKEKHELKLRSREAVLKDMDNITPVELWEWFNEKIAEISAEKWDLTKEGYESAKKEYIKSMKEWDLQQILGNREVENDKEIIVTKDWKEITTSKFKQILEWNKWLQNIEDPELQREIVSMYGPEKTKKYSSYLEDIQKDWKMPETIEEFDKMMNEQVVKRWVEAWKYKLDKDWNLMLDKDWNPIELSKEEKEKLANEIMQKMNTDSEYSKQMKEQMAWNQWISEAQASNIEAEPLNLSWTARERSINLVKHFESFSPQGYWDFKQASRWYGTKAPWIWHKITKEKAQLELENQIDNKYWAYKNFSSQITDKLWPNQIAALTSFLYNLWEWKASILRKPLEDYANWWDIKWVLNVLQTPRYATAWWQTLGWLVRRRKTEAKLFEEWWKTEESNESNTKNKA